MAITSNQVGTNNTLEQFRVEFNKLRNDVSSLEAGTINYTALAATTGSFGSLAVTGTFAVSTFQINGSDLIFEGSVADAFETTIRATNPTADRTVTIPDLSGTIQLQGQDLIVADDGNIGSASANTSMTIASDGLVTFNNGVNGIAVVGSVVLDSTNGSANAGSNVVQDTAANADDKINLEDTTEDVFSYRFLPNFDGQLQRSHRFKSERSEQLIGENFDDILMEDGTSDILSEQEFPFTKFDTVERTSRIIVEESNRVADGQELDFTFADDEGIVLEDGTAAIVAEFNTVTSIGDFTTEGSIVHREVNKSRFEGFVQQEAGTGTGSILDEDGGNIQLEFTTTGQGVRRNTTTLNFDTATSNRILTFPNNSGIVVSTGSVGAVIEVMMADDSVGSRAMNNLSTLLIKNSGGTTLKTFHAAGV